MAAENKFRSLVRQHVRATQADKFGLFGHSVKFANLGSGQALAPSETIAFVFDIVGSETDPDTWAAERSLLPPGDQSAAVAASFINGPSSDSAIGASNPPGSGAEVTLSDYSSDATAAGDLDATVTFSVASGQLTVEIENTTSGDVYDIDQVWFNSPATVDSLAYVSGPSGWDYTEKIDYVGETKDGLFEQDVVLKDAAAALYLGPKDVDGSWRFIAVGATLEVQRRVSGTWTTADTDEFPFNIT